MSYMKALYLDLRRVAHLSDFVLVDVVLDHLGNSDTSISGDNEAYAQNIVNDFRKYESIELFFAIKKLDVGMCIEVFKGLEDAHDYLMNASGYIFALFRDCGFNVFHVDESGDLTKPLSLSACHIRNSLWADEDQSLATLGYALEDCMTRKYMTGDSVREVFSLALEENRQYEFPESNSKVFRQKDSSTD